MTTRAEELLREALALDAQDCVALVNALMHGSHDEVQERPVLGYGKESTVQHLIAAFEALTEREKREVLAKLQQVIPNEETITAMKEARRGKLRTVGQPDDLLADLHADG